jgi:hypothetical protein
LRELGEELGGLVSGNEPVERPRLTPDGGHDLAATAWRRVPFNSGRIARFVSQEEPDREGKRRSTQNGPNERSFYLQILDAPVNLLAASETVQISAQNRAMPNTPPPPAPRRLKRPSAWPPAGSLDPRNHVRRNPKSFSIIELRVLMFRPGGWHCLCHKNGPEAH